MTPSCPLRPQAFKTNQTARQTHAQSPSLFVAGCSPRQPNASTWAFGLQVQAKPDSTGPSVPKARVSHGAMVAAPTTAVLLFLFLPSGQTYSSSSWNNGCSPTNSKELRTRARASEPRAFDETDRQRRRSPSWFVVGCSPHQPNAPTWAFGLQVRARPDFRQMHPKPEFCLLRVAVHVTQCAHLGLRPSSQAKPNPSGKCN